MKIKHIRKLTYLQADYIVDTGYRANYPMFIWWCSVCKGMPIRYYCKTEKTWVCPYCNTFCYTKRHDWEPLSEVKA